MPNDLLEVKHTQMQEKILIMLMILFRSLWRSRFRFQALSTYKILQPYITQEDAITSNKYPEGNSGYNLYVFIFVIIKIVALLNQSK